MHIHDKPASKRTPVRAEQAQLFAMLTRDLIQATQRQRGMELETFIALPEYQRFIVGAYACGFVCGDYALMDGGLFENAKARPREVLGSCSFRVLRHFMHMLLRAERWNHGFGSHVQEALDNGVLDVVASRLESDASLRKPELPDEV